MAKADILGESLWDAYSDKVTTLMNNPKHQGEIFEAEAEERGHKLIVADFGAESCGDAVRLYWEIDPKTDIIVNSKFKSFGCGTAIASSDVIQILMLRWLFVILQMYQLFHLKKCTAQLWLMML